MIEPLITFDTAVLAKEKGFTEDVEWFYYDHFGEIKILEWPLLFNHNDESEEHWSAPRQTLLQKWLRDTHKIHPYIEPRGDKVHWMIGSIRRNQTEILRYAQWDKPNERYNPLMCDLRRSP